MELVIIGSGSSWPNPARKPSCFHLNAGGFSFLLDAGEGCSTGLIASDIDYLSLDAVFCTHYHNDHVSGLIPLLFRYVLFAEIRTKPFHIYGPEGLAEFIKGNKAAHNHWLDEMPFDLIQTSMVNGAKAEPYPGLAATALQVEHSGDCLGYRFEYDGKIIAFSGDTRLCDNLYALAKNADVFVCEAGKPDRDEPSNHILHSEIGKVASECKVGKLVLTHFDRHFDEDDILRTIGGVYDGEILISEDGMKIYL